MAGVAIDAFADLYRTRYHRFVRVAEAITGDVELARDAVQDAFAKAIRERFAFRGDAMIETWVWRIVINTARSARSREPAAAKASDVDVADNGRRQREEDVTAAVALLPERQRMVTFLRYYADLDYSAIAETLEISVGTVGAALNSAHRALRRALEEAER
jgi:RNA polymerase sigma-70 factor, ECF subfamily